MLVFVMWSVAGCGDPHVDGPPAEVRRPAYRDLRYEEEYAALQFTF